MNNRLSWSAIRSAYAGQWVELTDSLWRWNSPYPKLARVRHHATNRNQLLELIKGDSPLEDSIILHVSMPYPMVHIQQDAAVV